MRPRPSRCAPPLQPMRSGVVDITGSPTALDFTNSPAHAVRWIIHEGFSPTSAGARIDSARNNGLWPIPTLGDQGYSNVNSFVDDLAALLDHVTTGPQGLYVEAVNEPGTGDKNNTAAEKQTNRDNALDRIFTPNNNAGSPNFGLNALQVAHSRGAKLSLPVMIAKSGSMNQLLTDIDNARMGSYWPDGVDSISLHPYGPEPFDVINALGSQRGQIDGHAGAKGKPILVTEVGWSCAVRADGTGNVGCAPDPHANVSTCDWATTVPGWLDVDRTISRAEQADKIYVGNGTGLWERMALRPDLRVLALCWFGHMDYGWGAFGTGNPYGHCGLIDNTGAQRTAWGRLNARPDYIVASRFYP